MSEIGSQVSKEGILRKRSGRLQRWTTRYFILAGSKLAYKLKPDSPAIKNCFDLQAGCAVTDVVKEPTLTYKGRKVYSFWILWPHDKNQKPMPSIGDELKGMQQMEDSDDEDAPKDSTKRADSKGLKEIVEGEVRSQLQQQKHIEQEVKNFKAQDHNVRLGAKVAAVAAGGAVVGLLTAGIGLIPYVALVGMTAAAGGGAIFWQSHSRPVGSRIIVAADTFEEAVQWKAAIEHEISIIERSLKPMLPASADAKVISSIIELSSDGFGWKCIGYREGMRILEHVQPEKGTVSRKAQLEVNCVPVSAFISVMEGQHWPKVGKLKIEKSVDDHVDILSATVSTSFTSDAKTYPWQYLIKKQELSVRTLHLARFWKLDDEGIYLITLNTTKLMQDQETATAEPTVNIVITVSPRQDHAEFYDELSSALVTCTVQVSIDGWKPGELNVFVNDLLEQQLLELRQSLTFTRFGFTADLSVSVEKTSSDRTSSLTVKSNKQTMSPDSVDDSFLITNPMKAEVLKTPTRSNRGTGVTTQQPGLDDVSLTAYNHNAAVNAFLEYGSTSKPNPPQSSPKASLSTRTLSLFRRNKAPPMPTATPVPVPAKVASSPDHKQEADIVEPPSTTRSRKFSRFSNHRKTLVANPEASQLRQQIAAKEYELDRIEKMVAKKVDFSHTDMSVATQQQIIIELRDLKAKYQNITGVAFETSARKRGPFSRVRSARIQPFSNTQALPIPLTTRSTSEPTISSARLAYSASTKNLTTIPSHWQHSVIEQEKKVITQQQRAKNHVISMLLAVGAFTVSMIASMLLREFLPRVLFTGDW